MPWPVHPNGLLGAQGDSDSYRIERSLRFNSGDSAYLTRNQTTPTTSGTFTLSFWLKRGSVTTDQVIFYGGSVRGAGQPGSDLYINSTGNIFIDNSTGSGNYTSYTSPGLLRDPSAWYHIVFNQTGATVNVYVNGVLFWNTTTTASNYFNSGVLHYIGTGAISNPITNFLSAYLAEMHFVDGQVLTPSSFGETDAITGRWKAKAYSGTYGANGFYLKFADNSAATAAALGKDSAGTNNFTPVNFSVTAGTGNDSLVDSPTNYGSDAGVGGETRGNYCTLNPLFGTVNTIQDGNLVLTGTAAGNSQRIGTMAVSSGKWYYETTLTTLPSTQDPLVGFTEINNASAVSQYPGEAASSYSIYQFSTNTFLKKVNANTFTNTNTTVASQGDILGVALDLTSGKIWFSKNGAWVDSGDPATGANAQFTGLSGTFVPAVRGTGQVATTTISCNFGQRPFAYTAPTGFKALCTTNLPTPTIKKPSSYFDAVTYTGTGATQTISSLGFSPDLLWTKGRSLAQSHNLFDTLRSGQRLRSDTTNADASTTVTLGSNGFTLGTESESNNNGSTFVAWSWDAGSSSVTNTSGSITSTVRANPQAGVSIVSYTGNGTNNSTIGHGLNSAPKMVIVKNRTTVSDWPVYHSSLSANNIVFLHLTQAQAAISTLAWGGVSSVSSTTFTATVGATDIRNVNKSGDNYIAYCFAEVEGYSKFGSYVGNASADGPFIYCGFRPKLIIGKRIDAVENWIIYDTSRDSFNVAIAQLQPNTSIAEATANSLIDFNSNGFKFRSTNSFNGNSSGGTHIFAAFAESPFKYARAR
jgi:hypothetical protein